MNVKGTGVLDGYCATPLSACDVVRAAPLPIPDLRAPQTGAVDGARGEDPWNRATIHTILSPSSHPLIKGSYLLTAAPTVLKVDGLRLADRWSALDLAPHAS